MPAAVVVLAEFEAECAPPDMGATSFDLPAKTWVRIEEINQKL